MKTINTSLIKMLSEHAGYDVATPHGAERLQKDIDTTTGERLSVNTIKRLTGVIHYEGASRTSTLEILARYLGFPSVVALEGAAHGLSSDFKLAPAFVDASKLAPDASLQLEWAPGRQMTIVHIEEGVYKVVDVINSKLLIGDILKIGYVAEGYPLLVKDVVRDGKSLGEYTAAAEGGLTKVELCSLNTNE